jgi:hypothetical protein
MVERNYRCSLSAPESVGTVPRWSRRASTSAWRYRRCPPRVRIDGSFPALDQRVTVFGSTRNSAATSPGVSKTSGPSPCSDIVVPSHVAIWLTDVNGGACSDRFDSSIIPSTLFPTESLTVTYVTTYRRNCSMRVQAVSPPEKPVSQVVISSSFKVRLFHEQIYLNTGPPAYRARPALR